VNVIGHPTGRLINSREGLPLDMARIIAAAAANGTALEINAGYPRLDLNEHHAREAVAGGVKLAIDTDAHSIKGLSANGLGLCVARRAWVEPENVINCWPFKKLQTFWPANARESDKTGRRPQRRCHAKDKKVARRSRAV